MSFERKLTNLTNLATSATATLRIPVGPTYDRITLRLLGGTGAAIANITNLRLLANAKVIAEWSDGAVVDAINRTYTRRAAENSGTSAPTNITLWFRRPEIKQFTLPPSAAFPNGLRLLGLDAQRVTSLRTGNLNTLTLEFTPNGTYSGVAGNVEAYSDEVPDSSEPIGLITKTRKFTYTPGAVGAFETLYDIPRGPRIMSVHYKTGTTMTITTQNLKANSVAVMDSLSQAAQQEFQADDGMTPALTVNSQLYNTLSFITNGNLDEALRTAKLRDLRNTINIGANPAQFDAIVEYLDTYDGL